MSAASQAARKGPARLASPDHLELIACGPDSSAHPPLLFVHGAYAGAWCWSEHFMPYFAQAGFRSYALSVRGHGESHGREGLALHSLADYVDDLEEAIAHIGCAPIVIGHSMGGIVAQKYLERASLPGTVLLASVPPQGMLTASFNLALLKPQLFSALNGLIYEGGVSLEAMREALFAGPVSLDRLTRYYALMQPESPRALWDMTFFDLPQRWRMQVPPLLVLGAERDLMVPPHQVAQCALAYSVEAEIFPAMGHAMMLEAGWQRVAERIVGWLRSLG
ncbi:MAG: alpha/beta hydrolase [Betaproteobacteria bacterium]|nr:alpha/beta hydrolase [Betaproteobacteria bacterium]